MTTDRRRRGFSIASILLLSCVCLTLVLTVAGLATFQLGATARTQASERALYLAQGAVAKTMSSLRHGLIPKATPFGRAGETVTFAPYADRPDAAGAVSFQIGTPWGYSTNNFDSTQGIGWGNAPVPPGTARLLARGEFAGAVRMLEVGVSVPRYNYVLSVDGPLSCSGPLQARAEASMASLAANAQAGTPDTVLPANVGSNTSITAGSGSLVTGDVMCKGSVNFVTPSSVLGTVATGQITPPNIQVTSFNNNSGTTPTLPAAPAGDVDLKVNTYAPASVTINGTLSLEDVSLYVEGGLTINGALSGNGAVFVHGDVTINGGANLNASDLVALLATGNVGLSGAPAAPKYFQGLVYTEGVLSASNITIAGTFVSASSTESTAAGTGLSLGSNVQVVYVPAATTMTQSTNVQAALSPGARDYLNQPVTGLTWNPGPTGPWCPTLVLQDNPTDSIIFKAIQSLPSYTPAIAAYLGAPTNSTGGSIGIPQELTFNTTAPVIEIGSINQWDANTTSTQYGMNYCSIQYDSKTNRFIPLNPPQVGYSSRQSLTAPDMPATQAQVDNAINSINPGVSTAQLATFFNQAQQVYMTEANKLLTNPQLAASLASVPDLSLNQFLSDQQPLHVVLWRER